MKESGEEEWGSGKSRRRRREKTGKILRIKKRMSRRKRVKRR